MYGAQHSAPTRARRQMQQSIEDAAQPLPEGDLAVVGGTGFDRPVDQKRAAHDRVAIDKSPVSTVGAVVTIVAHGEVLSVGYDDLIALNVLLDFVGPLRNQR